MKIVIAADKFKHSLTSFDVCNAIEEGLLQASPEFVITKLPLSDGGDGLADVLAYYKNFDIITENVCGPLWRTVQASYLFSEKEKTAVIEMAQASGLHLLKPSEYNCAVTTTFGTGELIRSALQKGAQKLIIGIGGSATNDCGAGMAAALGYRFFDANKGEVQPVGGNLVSITSMAVPERSIFQKTEFIVASDVTNFLTGEQGATRVYGPQKGATPQMVEELERGMVHFANLVKMTLGVDVVAIRGGGAAGGMGAGCAAFLGAKLVSGAQLVFEYSGAEQHIQNADLVMTGEGKIDAQTFHGKLVQAVTDLCGKHQKPVVALCGTLDFSVEQLQQCGLAAAFSILHQPSSLGSALQDAFPLLSSTAFSVGRLLAQWR